MKQTLAFSSFFLISRAVATMGVSACDMYSPISGKVFLAMTDQAGQQEVARKRASPVETSLA